MDDQVLEGQPFMEHYDPDFEGEFLSSNLHNANLGGSHKCDACLGRADRTCHMCNNCYSQSLLPPSRNNVFQTSRVGDGAIIFDANVDQGNQTFPCKLVDIVGILFTMAVFKKYEDIIHIISQCPQQLRVQCLIYKKGGRTILHEVFSRCRSTDIIEQFKTLAGERADELLQMCDANDITPVEYLQYPNRQLRIFYDRRQIDYMKRFSEAWISIGIEPVTCENLGMSDIVHEVRTACGQVGLTTLILIFFTTQDVPRQVMQLLRRLDSNVEKVLMSFPCPLDSRDIPSTPNHQDIGAELPSTAHIACLSNQQGHVDLPDNIVMAELTDWENPEFIGDVIACITGSPLGKLFLHTLMELKQPGRHVAIDEKNTTFCVKLARN